MLRLVRSCALCIALPFNIIIMRLFTFSSGGTVRTHSFHKNLQGALLSKIYMEPPLYTSPHLPHPPFFIARIPNAIDDFDDKFHTDSRQSLQIVRLPECMTTYVPHPPFCKNVLDPFPLIFTIYEPSMRMSAGDVIAYVRKKSFFNSFISLIRIRSNFRPHTEHNRRL